MTDSVEPDVARFDAKKARDKILKLQEKFNQKMQKC
jgi:hypothetical protein